MARTSHGSGRTWPHVAARGHGQHVGLDTFLEQLGVQSQARGGRPQARGLAMQEQYVAAGLQ